MIKMSKERPNNGKNIEKKQRENRFAGKDAKENIG